MEKYTNHEKIGEGTFGIIFKATVGGKHDKRKHEELECSTSSDEFYGLEGIGKVVALKKIKDKSYSDGVHFSALREVRHLHELSHANVIRMFEAIEYLGSVYLVLEYCDAGDLEDFLRNKHIKITQSHTKYLVKRIAMGLQHMHSSWILHRDVKPNNILLTHEGGVKLADFGYARNFGDGERTMTSQAVTRWYRPPELLFGASSYGAAGSSRVKVV